MKVEASDALVVVDVQNDFCPGGALAVAGGDEVVPLINRIVPLFHCVAHTRDWHPADHCSFSEAPEFVDRSWPAHCVADTPGAAFHPALVVPSESIVVSKGTLRDHEAYSAFEGTPLAELLRDFCVKRIVVCGLATDYCVKNTAIDGLRRGFQVVVLEDAIRGVDVPPGTAARALAHMRKAGVVLTTSGELA